MEGTRRFGDDLWGVWHCESFEEPADQDAEDERDAGTEEGDAGSFLESLIGVVEVLTDVDQTDQHDRDTQPADDGEDRVGRRESCGELEVFQSVVPIR